MGLLKTYVHFISILTNLVNLQCGRQSPGSRPRRDDRESEIPDHLLDSLESHRSQATNSTKVYHITINQPKTVIIGTAAATVAPVGEGPTRNVRVNEEYDQ